MSEEKADQQTVETPDLAPAGSGSSREEQLAKILEEDLLKAREELSRGYRDVDIEDGDETRKVRLIRSTKEIEDQAEKVRSGKYFEILTKNPEVPTEYQVIEALKSRGIWSDENDERIDEINARLSRIRNLVYKYEKEMSGSGARTFAKQIEKLEAERTQIIEERNRLVKTRSSFTEGTAEHLAGEVRRQFVMRHCILDAETEQPLWATEEEWLSAAQSSSGFWSECSVQLMLFWNGLPGAFDGTLETFSDGSLDNDQ